ncbi:MAG: hypothetical protein Q4B94_01315, partial [Pseudomonadota bacterium]|nr:hypothetical protein [Pseudomonadota bacterium]
AKGKGYVDGCQVRAHVSTARVLKQARGKDLERHAFKSLFKTKSCAQVFSAQQARFSTENAGAMEIAHWLSACYLLLSSSMVEA